LDADLIMLSIAIEPQRVFLFRDYRDNKNQKMYDSEGNTKKFYLNIKKMADQIVRHMSEICGTYIDEADRSNVLRDYVFLCFLLGNDFLPHHDSLTIKSGGIDLLIHIYAELRHQHQDRFLTFDKVEIKQVWIDPPFLLNIIQEIQVREDDLASKQISRAIRFRPYTSSNSSKFKKQKDLLNGIPKYYRDTEAHVKPGTKGWKQRYYRNVIGITETKEIIDVARNYAEGLFWTLQYYYYGCLSTSWYYRYSAAPTFSSLSTFLSSCKINTLVAPCIRQYSPVEQLSIVLPPSSQVMLPKALRIKFKQSSLQYYYPRDFEISTYGKCLRWECHCLIPDVDDRDIYIAKQQTKSEWTPDELALDKLNPISQTNLR
jgi:5'-3' exonuclease